MNKKTIFRGLLGGCALIILFSMNMWYPDQQPLAEDDGVEVGEVGAPDGRVSGGSRGVVDMLPTLVALAPNFVGKTLQASPTLYWSLSETVNKPLNFTLVHSDPLKYGIDPLLETTFDSSTQGIQSLDLAKHQIELKPNVAYQWTITIVMDAEQRSQDLTVNGLILRTTKDDLPKGVSLNENDPSTYEKAQLFYDALQILSEKIAQHPSNATLKQQRAALLENVGLKKILDR